MWIKFCFMYLLIAFSSHQIHCFAMNVPQHLQGAAKFLHDACVRESGVNEAHIENSKNGYLVDDRKLACYIYCLYSKIGVMDSKNHIKFDAIYHFLTADVKSILQNVVDKCNTIHGKDSCDTAYLTTKCFFEVDPEKTRIFAEFWVDLNLS